MCLECGVPTGTIKVVSTVSDPPALAAEDLSRIQQESQRLYAAFTARTASMEILTADDLKIRVLQRSRSSSPAAGDERAPHEHRRR